MIALMTRSQLTPAASAAVDKLLKDNPISAELSRFCKDRPTDILADLSTWADDARKAENTGAWHYVDIPMSLRQIPASGTSVDQWCHEEGKPDSGCVTSAIHDQLAVLKDLTKSGSDRARALRYVVHFMEDLHQPLHDSDNNDQGGNCTTIHYLKDEKPANLHGIWDYRILQTEMARRKLTQGAFVAEIEAEFAPNRAKWAKEKFDPATWAWEGHLLAVKYTYGLLKPAIPVAEPGPAANCDAERTKVAALNIAIGDEYINQSLPAIREQLAHSAARLANLLNATL